MNEWLCFVCFSHIKHSLDLDPNFTKQMRSNISVGFRFFSNTIHIHLYLLEVRKCVMHPESLLLPAVSLEGSAYTEYFYFWMLNQWSIENGLLSGYRYLFLFIWSITLDGMFYQYGGYQKKVDHSFKSVTLYSKLCICSYSESASCLAKFGYAMVKMNGNGE